MTGNDFKRMPIEEKSKHIEWAEPFLKELKDYCRMMFHDVSDQDQKDVWLEVEKHARRELKVIKVIKDEEEELRAEKPFWSL